MKYQLLVLFVVVGLVAAGPLDKLFSKLNGNQKNQLKQLVKDAHNKPRAQVKEDFSDFLEGLPEEMKKMINQQKELIDKLLDDAFKRFDPDNRDRKDDKDHEEHEEEQ